MFGKPSPSGSGNGYSGHLVLSENNKDKIEILKKKYGITEDSEHVNMANITDDIPIIEETKSN